MTDTPGDGYELKFRCRCGEHSFRVRYRGKDEDLITWMEGVVRPGMGAAHARLSPLCTAQNADLMMPLSESAKGIGMRTFQ
jgi:hypothetical protein